MGLPLSIQALQAVHFFASIARLEVCIVRICSTDKHLNRSFMQCVPFVLVCSVWGRLHHPSTFWRIVDGVPRTWLSPSPFRGCFVPECDVSFGSNAVGTQQGGAHRHRFHQPSLAAPFSSLVDVRCKGVSSLLFLAEGESSLHYWDFVPHPSQGCMSPFFLWLWGVDGSGHTFGFNWSCDPSVVRLEEPKKWIRSHSFNWWQTSSSNGPQPTNDAGPNMLRYFPRSKSMEESEGHTEERNEEVEMDRTYVEEQRRTKGTLEEYMQREVGKTSIRQTDKCQGSCPGIHGKDWRKLELDAYQRVGKIQLETVWHHQHLYMKSYRTKQGLELQNRTTRTQQGASTSVDTAIRELAFDDSGQLFACSVSSGRIEIWDFDHFRHASLHGDPDNAQELLAIDSCHRNDSVKWNPLNQNEIVCAGTKLPDVRLYDLQVCQNSPTEILRRSRDAGSSFSKRNISSHDRCSGICQLSISSQEPVIFAAGSQGRVIMWDRRAGCTPCGILSPARDVSAVLSVAQSSRSPLLFGGTLAGNLHGWDLRTGKTVVAFTSQRVPLTGYRQVPGCPLVISEAFQMLPDLALQTNIQRSGIANLSFDPRNDLRLGFLLNCGWSGVLDLYTQKLTHAHCPPWKESIDVSKGEWTHASAAFLVADQEGIRFLDFSPSPWARCRVDSLRKEAPSSDTQGAHYLTNEATTFSSHPVTDELVIGTNTGSILLAGHSLGSR